MLSLLEQEQMFVYYRSINHIEVAYYIMFVICGFSYLLAWIIMRLLVPNAKNVEVVRARRSDDHPDTFL